MIACIIPTLNEEDAIASVVEDVPSSIDGHDVVTYVVDGGSTDATRDEARSAGAEVVKQYYRGGKGAAMRQAFDEIDADIYVFLDGDGTYDPGEMRMLVRPILADEADHVIGSRLANREKGSISRFNLLGNRVFNFLVRRFYGADIRDMLSGYRAIDAETVRQNPVFMDGFGIETEMTILTLESDDRLAEADISYGRREGTSKLRPLRDGVNILRTIVLMARDTKPLKFFSFFASLFFLAALYPSYKAVMEKLRTGFVQHPTPAVLATLLFMFALQTFLFGMLADQQKNTQRRLEKLIVSD
ncbi:MAG: glycosyltransferase [Candidatus Nanohaloarchaea archaeon]|nr:glycosyltransferase [Candidatus Nanohaloarchaea archaeon]